MAKEISLSQVIEEIYQSLLATPKKQRRLKSSIFWSKFGVGRRTPDRANQIEDALARRLHGLRLEPEAIRVFLLTTFYR